MYQDITVVSYGYYNIKMALFLLCSNHSLHYILRFTGKKAFYIICGDMQQARPRFAGLPCNMRRYKAVGAAEQRMICRRRLSAQYIGCIAADGTFFQRCGNRLIMMSEGRIIYDVKGDEKKNLRVEDLLKRFDATGGEANDRLLLS